MKNIILIGNAYSGVNTAGKYIEQTFSAYRYIDMNYLVNSLYYDFKTLNSFTGAERAIARRSLILKNAEYMFWTLGIPEILMSNKMYEWTVDIDNHVSDVDLWSRIYKDMTKIQPKWRSLFAREKVVELASKYSVVGHIYNLYELEVVPNAISIFIDCDATNCYFHSSESRNIGMTFQNSIYDDVFKMSSRLRNKSDFIIHNNGMKFELFRQLDEINKLLKENDENETKH